MKIADGWLVVIGIAIAIVAGSVVHMFSITGVANDCTTFGKFKDINGDLYVCSLEHRAGK